jgi:hypothetical protein
MSNAIFNIAVPYNEPVLDYAPESPEKRSSESYPLSSTESAYWTVKK